MTENQDHDKLFADLDALSEEQIQIGLAAGVWSEQVRPLVQHYLYDLKLKRVEAAAEQLDDVRAAARVAVSEAVKSKTRATAALIIAAGAMLAAIAAALVAFRNQLTDVMAGRPCPWLHHQSSLRCCGVAARKGRLNGGVLHQRGQLNLSGECLDPPRAAIPERRIKVADRPMPDTGFPFAFLRSGYRLSGGKVDRKTRSGINVNQELMTELTAERVGDYSRDRRK
jgi:hypothetical protein